MEQRRSVRYSLEIPVTIHGKDGDGREFSENTRTLVVGNHGALIATMHQIGVGSELTIENQELGQSAKAKVVYLGKHTVKPPYEIAIQLIEPKDIWKLS